MLDLVKTATPAFKVLTIGGVAMALVLLSLGVRGSAKGNGGTPTPDSPLPTPGRDIPPIDAMAPTEVKTATFALG